LPQNWLIWQGKTYQVDDHGVILIDMEEEPAEQPLNHNIAPDDVMDDQAQQVSLPVSASCKSIIGPAGLLNTPQQAFGSLQAAHTSHAVEAMGFTSLRGHCWLKFASASLSVLLASK
jgi:hypothetical protein